MKIDRLSFSYDTQEIFSSAQIDFEPGVTVIMGPSGCGKTTLLKILTGALEAKELNIETTINSSLLVLQEDALIPWLTGWENLDFAHQSKDGNQKDFRSHKLCGLAKGFLDKKAWQMSFGQRRTIELIRALIFSPDLLCLDEPLNFIDPDKRKVLAETMFQDNGCRYTLITTHEWNDYSPYVSSARIFDGRFPVRTLRTIEM